MVTLTRDLDPREEGLVDEHGVLNDSGRHWLAVLLGPLPKVHEGMWKEVFLPMTSKLVRTCVDLALVRDGNVFLPYRKDEFWNGWAFPGGSLGPGESWADAAKRFAREELGIDVEFQKVVGVYNNTDNPRNHDVTVLLLCKSEEQPKDGAWFWMQPTGLIPVHEKYWEEVSKLLAS